MRIAHRQSGVVMIIAMIALVVLMVGAVALMRSKDTAQLTASNLAFKRDLVNQGEIGFIAAKTALTTGALAGNVAPQTSLAAENYSATQLASDIHGLPLALIATDAAFSPTRADIPIAAMQSTVRYVIDRQCALPGAYDPATCTPGPPSMPPDTSKSAFQKKVAAETRPIYRISVRVTGPRQTEAYLQMSVAF